MTQTTTPRRRPLVIRILLISLVAILILGGIGTAIWLQPYQAAPDAIAAMQSDTLVTVKQTDSYIAFLPQQTPASRGLVFYPGAKVVPEAYAYYMHQIADLGFATFIVKLPLNIAFLGANRADNPIHDYPQISKWAVGGHSLGGVVASSYANGSSAVSGLLLYASYPASSIASNTRLHVMSISGDHDGLATPQKIQDNKKFLPDTTVYIVVAGGIHSYFGDYGHQDGDGTATISRDLARVQILTASVALLATL